MKNASIDNPREWEEDGLMFTEVIYQEYQNCKFSAGFITGHAVDTIFLRLQRTNSKPTTILMRPDEAAAIAWCLNGVLFSYTVDELESEMKEIQRKKQLEERVPVRTI